mmetsp:Transcript_1329/g.2318  ORF Transcript_1329/g.2318 Transcript_1329/m.2318 type:complete len:504 (+) Transcript_1329:60-1571(+)|eukprot:CAMPEP_0169112880 /NCGR_PEP_ID=MMETSP1015-20121227/27882_1 /TAXON_ID=342587 /ORGANISM="Karlodinium micrum, Strain CCMP2283" /LENGTH=503 /DNA_ID=CAMNT_0009174969 /DNA_START=59 /DNA_END=1570 /DNA_ORIENTATION=+
MSWPPDTAAGCEYAAVKEKQSNAQVVERQSARLSPELEEQLASIQDRLDFEVRRLREEAQDREIAFTKALSQRPKGDEVLRDLAHAQKNFEALLDSNNGSTADILQGMNTRVCRLEEHCARQQERSPCSNPEVDLEPLQLDGGLGSPDKDPASPLVKEFRVLTVLDLAEQLRDNCRHSEEQERRVAHLAERLDYLVGANKEVKDGSETPEMMHLPALIERIDCLATALAHLDSGTQESLDRERREREALHRVLSERLAQEISDRTAIMSGLREEVENFASFSKSVLRSSSPPRSSPPFQYHFKNLGNSVEASVVRDRHVASPPASAPPEPLLPHPSLDFNFGKVSGFSSPQRNAGMLHPNMSPRPRCLPNASWTRGSAQATSPRRQTSQVQDIAMSSEIMINLTEKRRMMEHLRDSKTSAANYARAADRNEIQRSSAAASSAVTRSASQPQGPGRLAQQVAVLVTNGLTPPSCSQALHRPSDAVVAPMSPSMFPVRMSNVGAI